MKIIGEMHERPQKQARFIRNRFKKLEKKIKAEGPCGSEEDWHHVLQRVRKIEEFAIAQLAIKKYLEEHK